MLFNGLHSKGNVAHILYEGEAFVSVFPDRRDNPESHNKKNSYFAPAGELSCGELPKSFTTGLFDINLYLQE